MAGTETLHAVISQLEQEVSLCEQPALVSKSPGSADYLTGNRGGFIHLAIAALHTAEGQQQSLEKQTWFVAEESDWDCYRMTFDRLAHYDLPPAQTRWEMIRAALFGYFLLGSISVVFVVGIIATSNWLFHQVPHFFKVIR